MKFWLLREVCVLFFDLLKFNSNFHSVIQTLSRFYNLVNLNGASGEPFICD